MSTIQKSTCNSKNRIQNFCDPLRWPKDVSTFLLWTMQNCTVGVLHCLQYKNRDVIPKTEFKTLTLTLTRLGTHPGRVPSPRREGDDDDTTRRKPQGASGGLRAPPGASEGASRPGWRRPSQTLRGDWHLPDRILSDLTVILSYLITSCLVLSYLILSYLILFYLMLSYLILSYLDPPYARARARAH